MSKYINKIVRYIKKLFPAVVAAAVLVSFCGCGKTPFVKYDYKYDVLGLGEIPVGMWVTPPADKANDDTFGMIRDCGINFINGFGYNETDDDKVANALNLAETHGLKYLVNQNPIEQDIRDYAVSKDPSLIDDAMSRLDKFTSYPAYAGQLFIDEPGVGLFNPINDFVTVYKNRYPGKLWYANLLPTYAGSATGTAYEDYINGWLDATKPAFLSYDSYPLLTYDTTVPNIKYEMSDYYYNLDLLRYKTLEKGIPLWSFAATLAMNDDKREPSREDIRWEVFSDLAFGSKGIQYFTYWTPPSVTETFGDGLIDLDGNKTVRYDYVKELNAEFREYGKLLLNSNADGVMLNDIRKDGQYLYSSRLVRFGPVASAEGNEYVAGCFTDKDTGALRMLISPTTPREGTSVTLNFKKNQNVTASTNFSTEMMMTTLIVTMSMTIIIRSPGNLQGIGIMIAVCESIIYC